MELIYIGDRFYSESGTEMSSIYDVSGRRQSWGLVKAALRNGESVSIRPATKVELVPYEQRLEEIKSHIRNWGRSCHSIP